MDNLCLRDNGRQRLRPSTSHAHVHIRFVQMVGEGRVKAADVAQGLGAKGAIGAERADRSAAFGGKQDGVLGPHLDADGQAGGSHARGTALPAKPVAVAGPAGRGNDLRVRERFGQARQPGRFGNGIVVDEGDDLARRLGDAEIARLGNIGAFETDRLDRHVCRLRKAGTICDQNHLHLWVVLPHQRREAKLQVLGPPARDDDHAGGRRAHASPISASMDSMRGMSSGLFNSQNWRPRASTSTQRMRRPFSRKRNCSSPSSFSRVPSGQVG